MKPITFINDRHPLLEDYESLSAQQPEQYVGFVYIWYCIPEDMFYIGKHSSKVTSGYDGSGSRFKQVLRHYGITQFNRVILEYIQDYTTINHREQYWIDKFNAVRSKRFYNVRNSVK
jgi:hypothetical protein